MPKCVVSHSDSPWVSTSHVEPRTGGKPRPNTAAGFSSRCCHAAWRLFMLCHQAQGQPPLPGHFTCSPAPANAQPAAPLASSGSFGRWIPGTGYGPLWLSGKHTRPETQHSSSSSSFSSHLEVGINCARDSLSPFLGHLPTAPRYCHSPQLLVSFVPSLSAIILYLSSRGFSRALLVFFPNSCFHIHHQLFFFSSTQAETATGKVILFQSLCSKDALQQQRAGWCSFSSHKPLLRVIRKERSSLLSQYSQNAGEIPADFQIPEHADHTQDKRLKRDSLTQIVWNKMEAEKVDVTRTP